MCGRLVPGRLVPGRWGREQSSVATSRGGPGRGSGGPGTEYPPLAPSSGPLGVCGWVRSLIVAGVPREKTEYPVETANPSDRPTLPSTVGVVPVRSTTSLGTSFPTGETGFSGTVGDRVRPSVSLRISSSGRLNGQVRCWCFCLYTVPARSSRVVSVVRPVSLHDSVSEKKEVKQDKRNFNSTTAEGPLVSLSLVVLRFGSSQTL